MKTTSVRKTPNRRKETAPELPWASLGSYAYLVEARLKQMRQMVRARLWAKDPSLWSTDQKTAKTVANRLGWLNVWSQCATMPGLIVPSSPIAHGRFHARAAAGHGRQLAVPGGAAATSSCSLDTDLAVLDSPIRRPCWTRRRSPLEKTLPGPDQVRSTIETSSFFSYFYERRKRKWARRWDEISWRSPPRLVLDEPRG